MVRSRELGKYRKQPGHYRSFVSNGCSIFTPALKANLTNRFFPNREETTRITSYALLRCLHLPDEKLVTLSQDNTLRFHIRQKPPHYKLLSSHNVPSEYHIITDITRNTRGDYLAYTTLDANLYYFHIDRIDQPMRWNLFHLLQRNALSWNVCSNVSFNMDDKYLLVVESGGQLGVIRVDIARHHRFSFHAHQTDILAVSTAKASPNIFTLQLLMVWDNRSARNNYPVQLSATPSYDIAHFDSDSQDRYIVTTSACGTRIDIWDLRFLENRPFEIYRQQNLQDEMSNLSIGTRPSETEEYFFRAKFSPQITGNRYIYFTTSVGYLHVLDIATGEERNFHQQGTLIYNSSWHPENSEITCATLSGAIISYYHKEGESTC
ncbi:hypothetical protein DINM_007356 [Dirofilaria immitis]|nr:hypothetical protein [Dirofilaria immitis]